MAILYARQYMDEMLDDAAQVGLRVARRHSPVDTGRLRSRISIRSVGNTRRIASSVPYAKYVDPTYLVEAQRASEQYLVRQGFRRR